MSLRMKKCMSYERHPEAASRWQSAVEIIKAIVALDIHEPFKRKVLANSCLWLLTQAEARGKYKLRYQSRESQSVPKRLLRHEHVVPRKKMVDDLIKHPDQVDKIVEKAVACVVTKAEHEKLAKVDKKYPNADGWERYGLAGIEVIDMVTGQPRED